MCGSHTKHIGTVILSQGMTTKILPLTLSFAGYLSLRVLLLKLEYFCEVKLFLNAELASEAKTNTQIKERKCDRERHLERKKTTLLTPTLGKISGFLNLLPSRGC